VTARRALALALEAALVFLALWAMAACLVYCLDGLFGLSVEGARAVGLCTGLGGTACYLLWREASG
jgi:uncharacterized protein (DUF697 family)